MTARYLSTGQILCYDNLGQETACQGSGQDAEFRPGVVWPSPRFIADGPVVRDELTGLVWLRDANQAGFPLSWSEALEHVATLAAEGHAGRDDWRLPNRRELRSLISYANRNPALISGHPFANVYLGWYWSSTSAAINPAYAWYVHLEGGRMFYGHKSQYFLVWPVAGRGNGVLACTGQTRCYDTTGIKKECPGTGHDAELMAGTPWPEPRFVADGPVVRDELTSLVWTREADLSAGPLTWRDALKAASKVVVTTPDGYGPWRLPTINELESLVDAGRHTPALPDGHPFANVAEAYWSSTSSSFEPDWAMALYLHKGAVGVGQKPGRHFCAWAVCSPFVR